MPRPQEHASPSAPLSGDQAEELAQFMAAFATASRVQLLFALFGVERTVEELADVTGLSPSVVSQQLRVLRLLNLARSRRDGRYMRYRLYDDHVADLLAAIRHHSEHAAGSTTRLSNHTAAAPGRRAR
jgi:ArsR family transcriptional regulator